MGEDPAEQVIPQESSIVCSDIGSGVGLQRRRETAEQAGGKSRLVVEMVVRDASFVGNLDADGSICLTDGHGLPRHGQPIGGEVG